MMPQEASVAQVIISRLEQPHKFDFVIQCKCGFQSHGYANEDASLGEANILAKQAAATHLINRHGAKPAETADRIRELEKPTSGGMSYRQLELLGQTKGFKKEMLIVDTPTLSKEEIDKSIEWDKTHPTQEEAERKILTNESKEKLPSPASQAQKPATAPSPATAPAPAPAAKPPQPAVQIAALKAEAAAKKPETQAKPNEVQTGGTRK